MSHLTEELCSLIWNQAPFSLALFEWSDEQHDWLCLDINPAGFVSVEERLKPGSWLSVAMPYHLDSDATDLGIPLIDYYYQILLGGTPKESVISYLNGELQRPIYWNYSIPLENGRMFMFFLDISERKTAQIAIKQAEESAQSFGSIIAHSLKNFSLDNAAIIRQFKRGRMDAGKMVEELEGVRERQDSLLEGLRQTFSSLQKPLDLEPIRIGQFLAAVTTSCGARFEVAGDISTMVRGDKDLLAEVGRILVMNAIKFSGSDRGDAQWRVTDTHSARGVRVELTDTGVGFDPKQVSRLFQNVHGRLHPKVEGSGVGLYTVKGIVTRLNSGRDISVTPYGARSDGIDKGATFWFELRKTGDDLDAPKGRQVSLSR